jgi:HK97 family phage prohead protease
MKLKELFCAAPRRTLFATQPRLAIAKMKFAINPPAGGVPGQPPQFLLSDDGEERTVLTGYAAVWGDLSDARTAQDEDGNTYEYFVRLQPGSANYTTPAMALFHHDFKAPLGNTANGTLRINNDAKGSQVQIILPDTTTARDLAELVEDRYVQGMSFAMLMDGIQAEEKMENGKRILEVASYMSDEVTVTAIPAFTGTSIDVQDQQSSGPVQLSRGRGEVAPERIAQSLLLERYKLDALTL